MLWDETEKKNVLETTCLANFTARLIEFKAIVFHISSGSPLYDD